MHVKDATRFFDGAFATVAIFVGAALVDDNGSAGADELVHAFPGGNPGRNAKSFELPDGSFEAADELLQEFFAVDVLTEDILESGDGSSEVSVVFGGAIDVDADSHVDGRAWGIPVRYASICIRHPLAFTCHPRGGGDLCINDFCQNPAELAFSAEDIVRPFYGNFSDVLVAEALCVRVVLQALQYFSEGDGCNLRDLRCFVEWDSFERNQNIEVEVLAGRGVPSAFVAATAFCLRVGDNQGAGYDFAC